jgi:hypothetical protein
MEESLMSDTDGWPDDPEEELNWYAKQEIIPWDRSPTPGPSHKQWMEWEKSHGEALRLACMIMMCTKEQLGDLVEEYERDGGFELLLDTLEHSAGFFKSMAKTIEGAQARIFVGAGVYSQRPNNPPLKRKPQLSVVGKAVQS